MKITVYFILLLMSFNSIGQSKFDHSLFDQILKKHVINGYVDYKAIKMESKLDEYLSKLSSANISQFSKDEQLAFWINAYNAYTIKLIVDKYPVKSIKDIGFSLIASPWDRQFAFAAGKKYSLNNIEHDIIRKNFNEPRIHFVLVCAAISCPPLRSEAFTGSMLNDQFEDQVQKFFGDKSKNYIDKNKKQIYVSSIMDWYKNDFEKTGNYKENIWNYFPKELRSGENSKDYSVKYLDYDWSLNGK